MAFDNKARLANQKRLRELKRDFGREITLICSHDPAELAASDKPEEPAEMAVLAERRLHSK